MNVTRTTAWRTSFVIVAALFAQPLRAQSIGPLHYSGFADSPFAGRGLSGSFFVDDFNAAPTLFFQNIGGIQVPYSKPSTPGAVIEPEVYWSGNSIKTVGGCTASIPASCFSNLQVKFDASELGYLPQSVGIAVTGFGRVGLRAYDANDDLVATIAPTDIFMPPLGVDFPPPFTAFLGAEFAGGIARFILDSNDAILEADDLQYGRLIPEPHHSRS